MKKSTAKALAKHSKQQAISKKKAKSLESLKVFPKQSTYEQDADLDYYKAAAHEAYLENDMGGTSSMLTTWR